MRYSRYNQNHYLEVPQGGALQICAVELQWKCIEKTVILKNYGFFNALPL